MSTQIDVTTGDTTSVSVSDPSGYSEEEIEDMIAEMIKSGLGIENDYDDADNEFMIHSLTYMLEHNTF